MVLKYFRSSEELSNIYYDGSPLYQTDKYLPESRPAGYPGVF